MGYQLLGLFFSSLFLEFQLLGWGNSYFIILMGFGISFWVGCMTVLDVFIKPKEKFNFLSLLASSSLIGTAGGTLSIFLQTTSIEMWNSLQQKILLEPQSIFKAQLLVNLYCAILFILARKSHFKLINTITNISFSKKNKIPFLFIIFIFSCFQIFLLLSNKIGYLYSGVINEGLNNQVNIGLQLTLSFAPVIISMAGLIYKRIFRRSGFNPFVMLFYVFCLLTQLGWFFIIASRRPMIISFFLYFFSIRISFPELKLKRTKIVKGLFLVAILVVPLFNFISFSRFYNQAVKKVDKENIATVLKEYIDIYLPNGDLYLRHKYADFLRTNVSERPFVLYGFARIVQSVHRGDLFWGEELRINFLKSIPRIFFNEKTKLLAQEELYKSKYRGLEDIRDFADSFFLSAFVNFGWFGMLIYPLLIYFTVFLLIRISFAVHPIYGPILVMSSLFFLCCQGAESSMITFFVMVRDTLIFYCFLSISLFFRKRLKESQPNHFKY